MEENVRTISELQGMLGVAWFDSEVTDNHHIRIDARLAVTPELEKELTSELKNIIVNVQLGIKPTALQKLAYDLLRQSY